MTLRIREALPTDVPALVDLAARTFPLACPPELSRSAVEEFVRRHLDEVAFRRYLGDRTHTVLVGCESDGRTCAYALLVDGTAMDDSCAELITSRPTMGISKFYLDPAHHGGGGAAQLLDAVMSTARTRGVESLWLATNVANGRARTFYLKNGFLPRGNRIFEVGGFDNVDVVYELPVTTR
ncbi:GNAT family N-acetyltransferase [Rhodococcus sp. IEGM 1408]|uniref:GNAT family N-acetyltransferase n=1 Tax=Rhodococcus sp. IEGM 1408 TaxID=3082220 RepID=UPI0029534BD5|nr:GNAT family N-acetyltransferase [Rhodococcus sp. IEGM 1408]MDV8000353.1 GNAT family N-acetyltransferase [Rhodococcus sp. IEGM 1408]